MNAIAKGLLDGTIKSGVVSDWRWGCRKCGAHETNLENRPAARDGLSEHRKVCPGKPEEQPPAEIPLSEPVAVPPPPSEEELAEIAAGVVSTAKPDGPSSAIITDRPEGIHPVGPTGPSDEEAAAGMGFAVPPASEPEPEPEVAAPALEVPCFGHYDADEEACGVCHINEECAREK